MRIALGIEYNGQFFHGWQRQPGLRTIQGCLETALSKIANESIQLYCAGRTDTGVHALGQVVHFDTKANRSMQAWVRGANTYLSHSIAVQWAVEVDEQFHARFSALSRCYQYIIYNHPIRSALFYNRATWYPELLNILEMQTAANYLLGENDFSSFRSSECDSKTPMRCVHHIHITSRHHLIIITIQANAFLHHMVRNIVGVLKKIGMGSKSPDWAKEVLTAKDRRVAADTAPADGLYLVRVQYPAEYSFPRQVNSIFL